jgi:hypothetical protein
VNVIIHHNGRMVAYVVPLVLTAAFVGLCLVLRDEQRSRRRNSDTSHAVVETDRAVAETDRAVE